MPHNEVPPLEDSIEIAAPPARVWNLVSDIRRMSEWSPQVDRARICDVPARIGLGVRFESDNSHGELQWQTRGQVVRFVPQREIAFRIEENWVIWSFQLAPNNRGGTVLTQRRESPDGISDLSARLIDQYMGGPAAFTETMRDGMRRTLEAIRAAALGDHPG